MNAICYAKGSTKTYIKHRHSKKKLKNKTHMFSDKARLLKNLMPLPKKNYQQNILQIRCHSCHLPNDIKTL